MHFTVLGGVEAQDPDGPLSVGGPVQHRLLGVLLVHANHSVSNGRLLEALFDGEAADGALHALRTYVSRLRSALGEGVVETTPGGYRLVVADPEDIDAARFEHLVSGASAAGADGDPARALTLAESALAQWRGRPYLPFSDEAWAVAQVGRLEELWWCAREQRVEARLALGAHREVVGEAELLAHEAPLRERPRAALMLALYRSGRQAEALRVFEAYRSYLADETGLQPSAAITALERRIVEGDPSLDVVDRTRAIRGYRLHEKLAEGAFGAVYRGVQPVVGREVAVKIVKPELADDPAFIGRFEAEAQLVARLEHPHIVPLYDYWREPGGAYLVMRYLRGGSAEQRLVERGPFLLADALRLVEQIGEALAVAHAAGVVHRDVKPANVLYDETGNAYLADFGIAVDAVRVDSDGSEVGSAGSPLYAAPEQIRNGSATPASDIYAFGVLLWEVLAGRTPYDADSLAALVSAKTSGPLASVLTERPDLPSAIDAVIRTATSPDPAKRFADMGELILAFRSAAAGLARGATTTEDEPGPRQVAAPEDRPRARASRTLLAMRLEQVNPYKGLRAFGEADANDFFGREAATVRLQDALASSRFVAVVGPSGSGKSSLVRAGLVPSLRAQDAWVATMVPGAHPFDQAENALLRFAPSSVTSLMDQMMSDDRGLARAIGRVLPDDSDTELVLIVDQFEELFTHADAETRSRFASALVHVASDERFRARVLVTLRADFYDRPLTVPGLGELVRDHTVAMTPLDGDELERSITHPASRVGVSVEPALVAKLVADATTNPASLPLLQYSLTELYEQRTGGRMTLAAYTDLGGLAGAVAGRAEDLCASVADVEDVRRLFTRLVTPGEGTEDTRRRARRSELAAVPDEIVDAFGTARLLAFDHDPATREPTVEVAHEALIRNWPRLRGWLAEDRESLRVLRHLSDSAGAWESRGRDSSELYRGARLAAATDLVAAGPERLTELESEFVGASREAADADGHRRRRNTRRLRRFAVGLGIALVCALIAGVVAVDQRRNADDAATDARQQAAIAQDQTKVARARRLLSEAQVIAPENLPVALLLASEAVELDPTIDTAGLIGLIPPRLERIQTFGGEGIQGGVGPDGRTVPVATAAGDVYLWDVESGAIEQALTTGQQQNSVSIASDGRHLVTAGTHSGEVAVWDLTSGEEVARTRSREPFLIADPVTADASVLLVSDSLVSASLVRIEGDSARVLWTIPMPMSTIAVASPNGKLVAAGRFLPSGTFEIVLYDANTQPAPRELAVLRSTADAVWSSVSFGPDSQVLAESNGSGVRLYDVRDPTSPTLVCSYGSLGGETEEGGFATFSSDGQLVAVGRRGAVAGIAVPSCEEIAVSSTKQGGAFPLGFVGDGGDLRVVVGSDTESRVLRVAPAHLMARVLAAGEWPFGPITAPFTVQYDANGSPLGTAWQSVLRGSELSPQQLSWSIASRDDGVEAASFGDPDVAGSAYVVLSRGGRELARIDTGRRFGPYVWFTPDGRRLVVGLRGDDLLTRVGLPFLGGPDGYTIAVVYDVTDPGSPVELARHELDDHATLAATGLRSVDAAASPDGSLIALASVNSSQILLLDADTGAISRRFDSSANIWWNGVDFVDDHTLVGAGNVYQRDNVVFWEVNSGEELEAQSVGATTINSVAVNRRSGIVAFGHANGTLSLFDAGTLRQLGPAIDIDLGSIAHLEFRDDGQRLLVAYADGIVEWDLSRDAWKQAVCDVVGRNLTVDESRRYFDGDPTHTSTCPGA